MYRSTMQLAEEQKQGKPGEEISEHCRCTSSGSTRRCRVSRFFGKQAKVNLKPAHCWEPPPHDVLKINIDGSIVADLKRAGWGFVIRDV